MSLRMPHHSAMEASQVRLFRSKIPVVEPLLGSMTSRPVSFLMSQSLNMPRTAVFS